MEVEGKATRTRAEVSKRYFRLSDGTYVSRANNDVVGFRFDVLDETGEVFESFEGNFDDYNESVIRAAAMWGMMTSAGNTTGGKSLTPQERAELVADRLGLFADGEWTGERQSGPRSSQLLEAIIAVRAAGGAETTEEQKATLATKLQDEEEKKKWMANGKVAAALAQIKAEAAMERAKKAAAKATADSDDLPEI